MDEHRTEGRNPTDLPLSREVVRLVDRANEESVRRDHQYVGTEHLVLALSREDDAGAPLLALGVERQRVYTMIDATIRRGNAAVAAGITRPLTSRTKQAFALAAAAAHELGHSRIDVPHLVVGLMRERLNIGAQVLTDQGLTEERALAFARDRGAGESSG
jgi:ATP-dependent Clp protease ATP-binding subunit ClpC